MEGRALDELLINKVTVTANTGIDQAQLPGLPPIPKKRGRPATGNAKTPAQRKRDSRSKASRSLLLGPELGGKPVSDLTITQLIEGFSRCMHVYAFTRAEEIAVELQERARRSAVDLLSK